MVARADDIKKEFLPLLLVFASSQRSKMGEFFSFFAFIIVSIPYFVLILCLPCYI
jgi:ABC-type dipeptide/oligopeptide/nickel transport system permease component